MDIDRIQREVRRASETFALVELSGENKRNIHLRAGLQTSGGSAYIITMYFPNYPHQMPRVFVNKPKLRRNSPHRYPDGNLCYLHPSMWNPGAHDISFVLARTAKWLNKYEVWRHKGRWPGAEVKH